MEKHDFFKILCSSTPEELNELISLKGKKKAVNAVTFLSDDYLKQQSQNNYSKDESK